MPALCQAHQWIVDVMSPYVFHQVSRLPVASTPLLPVEKLQPLNLARTCSLGPPCLSWNWSLSPSSLTWSLCCSPSTSNEPKAQVRTKHRSAMESSRHLLLLRSRNMIRNMIKGISEWLIQVGWWLWRHDKTLPGLLSSLEASSPLPTLLSLEHKTKTICHFLKTWTLLAYIPKGGRFRWTKSVNKGFAYTERLRTSFEWKPCYG